MARFLAYGGTEYTIRCQMGSWHDIEVGALQDKYGLDVGPFCFGVGVDSGSAFLIYKQLQTGTAERAYSYCFFLDPGIEVWDALEWNPAKFLKRILRSARFDELINSPETFQQTPQTLADLLTKISQPDTTTDLVKVGYVEQDDVTMCLVGMAISDLDGSSCVSLHSPRMIDLDELERKFERLPVCVRLGQGWFIFGRPENARTFRSQLVVVRDADHEVGEGARAAIDVGREFLESWAACESAGFATGLLRRAPKRPLTVLDEQAGLAADSFIRGVSLLGEFLQLASPDEHLIAQVRDYLGKSGELGKELKVAISRLPSRLAGPLTPHLSTLYLDFRISEFTSPEDGEKLDAQAAINWHERSRMDPSASGLTFDSSVLTQIYLTLIASEPEVSKLPEWLSAGTGQVREKNNDSRALCLAAIRRTEEANNFSVWFDTQGLLNRIPALHTVLRERLVDGVLGSSDRADKVDWPFWYLESGVDPGGHFLQERGVPSPIVIDLLFKRLLDLVSSRDVADQLRAWIDALADSEMRPHVPNKYKQGLTEFSSWGDFAALLAIVEGAFEGTPKRAAVARVQSLTHELEEFVREKGTSTLSKAQVKQIRGLLGDVPKEVQDLASKPKHYKGTKDVVDDYDARETAHHPLAVLYGAAALLVEMKERKDDPFAFLLGLKGAAPQRTEDLFACLSLTASHGLFAVWQSTSITTFTRVVTEVFDSIKQGEHPTWFSWSLSHYLMTDHAKEFRLKNLVRLGNDVGSIERVLSAGCEKAPSSHQCEPGATDRATLGDSADGSSARPGLLTRLLNWILGKDEGFSGER